MKKIRAGVAVVFVFMVLCGRADAYRPFRSFTIVSAGVGCTGDDYYLNLADRTVGAGIWPTGPSVIVGYDMWSFLPGANDYVMIGKTQPYGDAITHYQYGPTGQRQIVTFAGGNGFPFDPTHPSTEQLHQHYMCAVSEGSGSFGVTIFYTLNSDPSF